MSEYSQTVIDYACQYICSRPCDRALRFAQIILDDFDIESVIGEAHVDSTNRLVCPYDCGSEDIPMSYA
jgi:hypothetical protein